MAKILLITDTHFGCRNDNATFNAQAVKFFQEVFFPYLANNTVDMIIHLGDLVDRRKAINFQTSNILRHEFLEPLARRSNIPVHIIAGNHDVSFNNTNRINALKEIVGGRYPNIHIHSNSCEITIGGEWNIGETEIVGEETILLLPWINDENRERAMRDIAETDAKLCFGHLELIGFKHYKNTPEATHGMDALWFRKFELVCSGHYHHKSQKHNIHYLGAPYQMNWSDHADPRGFHVFDTETRELEFIENPFGIHAEFVYDDRHSPEKTDFGFFYTDKIVRILVKHRENQRTFDAVVKALEAVAVSVQVIDQQVKIETQVLDYVVEDHADDIETLLVKAGEDDENQAVTDLLVKTYKEALNR